MEKEKNSAFDFEKNDKTENFTADDNGTNLNKITEEESVNTLDSLLYESDDSDNYSSSEPDPFESFFAEYRQFMASNLAAASESKAEEKKADDALHSIINDIQSTIGSPEATKPKVAKKKTVKRPHLPLKVSQMKCHGRLKSLLSLRYTSRLTMRF